MKITDSLTRHRLAGLRAKLPANTALSLHGVTKQLLKAGFTLPCTGEEVSHFLLEKADNGLKISSLRNYCSIVIKWHRMAGYDEAATDIQLKAYPVINGLKQERIETGSRESRKTATPLLLEDALRINDYLMNKAAQAEGKARPMAMQDLALFRLLWWSGCRESELTSLKRWQVTFTDNPRGIMLEWSKTKTDQNGTGTSRFIPSLPNADPMGALIDWIDLYWPSHAGESPDMTALFIRQHRNCDWRDGHMHPNSIPPWLRRIAKEAGVSYADKLSGHSCRHGLATLMSDSVSLREVMDYFKWKRAETALGYSTNKGISPSVISTLSNASIEKIKWEDNRPLNTLGTQ